MIVITGAAGFIGSYLVGKLNEAGYDNLILVDKFDDPFANHTYGTRYVFGKISHETITGNIHLNL